MSNVLGGVSLGNEVAAVASVLRELQSEEIASVRRTTTPSSSSGAGSTALGVIENVFGLGLSPLVSGLIGFFGGGDSTGAPAALAPYVTPPSVHVSAGYSASANGVFAVDGTRPAPSSANVTVNVQAMDSKSFLDHSQDIAAAVRQAMLESSTLNDVIREV
jgi:hypothetical protein